MKENTNSALLAIGFAGLIAGAATIGRQGSRSSVIHTNPDQLTLRLSAWMPNGDRVFDFFCNRYHDHYGEYPVTDMVPPWNFLSPVGEWSPFCDERWILAVDVPTKIRHRTQKEREHQGIQHALLKAAGMLGLEPSQAFLVESADYPFWSMDIPISIVDLQRVISRVRRARFGEEISFYYGDEDSGVGSEIIWEPTLFHTLSLDVLPEGPAGPVISLCNLATAVVLGGRQVLRQLTVRESRTWVP
jgi:hypothetical protein